MLKTVRRNTRTPCVSAVEKIGLRSYKILLLREKKKKTQKRRSKFGPKLVELHLEFIDFKCETIAGTLSERNVLFCIVTISVFVSTATFERENIQSSLSSFVKSYVKGGWTIFNWITCHTTYERNRFDRRDKESLIP